MNYNFCKYIIYYSIIMINKKYIIYLLIKLSNKKCLQKKLKN